MFAFIGKLVTGDLGPVIITIVRVGKNGRRFYYHKFRTMYMDAVSRCDKWIMEGKKEWILDILRLDGFSKRLNWKICHRHGMSCGEI
ncbi:MAG: sugar transferase [Agathobacter rectalis]